MYTAAMPSYTTGYTMGTVGTVGAVGYGNAYAQEADFER